MRGIPRHYSSLSKRMPVVTERMLSLQLKQLEEDGLISRKAYNAKPTLKVEYELTDFGKSALPLLEIMAAW